MGSVGAETATDGVIWLWLGAAARVLVTEVMLDSQGNEPLGRYD
jgi:hypothetical protein